MAMIRLMAIFCVVGSCLTQEVPVVVRVVTPTQNETAEFVHRVPFGSGVSGSAVDTRGRTLAFQELVALAVPVESFSAISVTLARGLFAVSDWSATNLTDSAGTADAFGIFNLTQLTFTHCEEGLQKYLIAVCALRDGQPDIGSCSFDSLVFSVVSPNPQLASLVVPSKGELRGTVGFPVPTFLMVVQDSCGSFARGDISETAEQFRGMVQLSGVGVDGAVSAQLSPVDFAGEPLFGAVFSSVRFTHVSPGENKTWVRVNATMKLTSFSILSSFVASAVLREDPGNQRIIVNGTFGVGTKLNPSLGKSTVTTLRIDDLRDSDHFLHLTFSAGVISDGASRSVQDIAYELANPDTFRVVNSSVYLRTSFDADSSPRGMAYALSTGTFAIAEDEIIEVQTEGGVTTSFYTLPIRLKAFPSLGTTIDEEITVILDRGCLSEDYRAEPTRFTFRVLGRQPPTFAKYRSWLSILSVIDPDVGYVCSLIQLTDCTIDAGQALDLSMNPFQLQIDMGYRERYLLGGLVSCCVLPIVVGIVGALCERFVGSERQGIVFPNAAVRVGTAVYPGLTLCAFGLLPMINVPLLYLAWAVPGVLYSVGYPFFMLRASLFYSPKYQEHDIAALDPKFLRLVVNLGTYRVTSRYHRGYQSIFGMYRGNRRWFQFIFLTSWLFGNVCAWAIQDCSLRYVVPLLTNLVILVLVGVAAPYNTVRGNVFAFCSSCVKIAALAHLLFPNQFEQSTAILSSWAMCLAAVAAFSLVADTMAAKVSVPEKSKEAVLIIDRRFLEAQSPEQELDCENAPQQPQLHELEEFQPAPEDSEEHHHVLVEGSPKQQQSHVILGSDGKWKRRRAVRQSQFEDHDEDATESPIARDAAHPATGLPVEQSMRNLPPLQRKVKLPSPRLSKRWSRKKQEEDPADVEEPPESTVHVEPSVGRVAAKNTAHDANRYSRVSQKRDLVGDALNHIKLTQVTPRDDEPLLLAESPTRGPIVPKVGESDVRVKKMRAPLMAPRRTLRGDRQQ